MCGLSRDQLGLLRMLWMCVCFCVCVCSCLCVSSWVRACVAYICACVRSCLIGACVYLFAHSLFHSDLIGRASCECERDSNCSGRCQRRHCARGRHQHSVGRAGMYLTQLAHAVLSNIFMHACILKHTCKTYSQSHAHAHATHLPHELMLSN